MMRKLPPVGTRLPALERRLDLTSLVAYGAATWDWHKIHYDAEAAQAAGLRAPIADGQMFGALLAKQAIDWAGPEAVVRRLRFRCSSPVYAGDLIRCEATVTAAGSAGERCSISLQQVVSSGGIRVVDSATLELEVRMPH